MWHVSFKEETLYQPDPTIGKAIAKIWFSMLAAQGKRRMRSKKHLLGLSSCCISQQDDLQCVALHHLRSLLAIVP